MDLDMDSTFVLSAMGSLHERGVPEPYPVDDVLAEVGKLGYEMDPYYFSDIIVRMRDIGLVDVYRNSEGKKFLEGRGLPSIGGEELIPDRFGGVYKLGKDSDARKEARREAGRRKRQMIKDFIRDHPEYFQR